MIIDSISIAPPLPHRCTHLRTHSLKAVVALMAVWASAMTHAQSPPTTPLQRVVVAEVVVSEVRRTHRVVGTVNPVRTSILGSAVAGRVEALLFEVGDAVDADDVVSSLRDATMQLERAAAAAERDLAVQQLAELENGPLPEDVAEAEARALGAKSSMQNSATSLRRLRALITTGAATVADIEAAEEQASITEYAFKAAEAVRKRTTQGPRVELIEQAKARLDLQVQNLALIDDRIDKLKVVSPFKGFVAAKFTEVGAWINIGDPVVQIIELDEVEILAPTMADVAVKLKRGDSVSVEFPDLPGEVWSGVVYRVVPVADARARTYPVTIRLKNISNKLLPGMLAQVILSVGEPVTGPMVPKDALVLERNEKKETLRSVFVVEPDANSPGGPPKLGDVRKVRKVPVQLGVEVEEAIQVIGDIKDGEYVVTVGNERLVPKRQVELMEVRPAKREVDAP